MTYKMAVFPMLIVLLCALVSEATNLEGEGVCPALGYWNLKLPNTSIPNVLREAICPHTIPDHLFDKNIQEDVKSGDVSISSEKYSAHGGGDATIYSHKYFTPQVGDVSMSSQKYIPSRGGDATVYSHKYITPQVEDVSISSHNYVPSRGGDATVYSQKYIPSRRGDATVYSQKYIPSRGGDATVYSHKYITPQVEDVSISSHNYIPPRGGDATLYNHKYIIDRDASPKGGDITLDRDRNQANVKYHRQLFAVDPLLSIFFFEKDLHIGTNLMVHLEVLKAHDLAGFIPRSIANQIPFSLEKLLVAQNMLNVPQDSHMTIAMEKTLKKCESPAISGETTYCATSIESMIDYSTTKFGSNNLNVLVTDLPSNFNSQNNQYSITAMFAKSNSSSKPIICHNLVYPYAIYMCHEAKGTKIFELSLKGQGTYGRSIPVVVICHADTSGWNPKHVAFVALNVKPGKEGICHFMLEGTIAWLLAK